MGGHAMSPTGIRQPIDADGNKGFPRPGPWPASARPQPTSTMLPTTTEPAGRSAVENRLQSPERSPHYADKVRQQQYRAYDNQQAHLQQRERDGGPQIIGPGSLGLGFDPSGMVRDALNS